MTTWPDTGTSTARTHADLLQAALDPPNYRGAIAGNTTYSPRDMVIYRGRRILVTTEFTTGAAPVTFVSAANYLSLDPEHDFHAADYGSLSSNPEVAIQAALDEAFDMGLAARVILPQGVFSVSAQIDIPWGCVLEGAGMFGATILQPADGSDLVAVRVHKSTGSGDANAAFAGLRNIGINGRRSTMTSSSAHGVILETNPLTTGQSGTSGNHPEFFDPHNILENVAIRSCKGDGVHLLGRSAHHLRNVWCQNNDGYGFYGTFDTTYIHCEAEGSGSAGWLINNGSQRLVGCKSFLNGRLDGGPGYDIGSNGHFASLAGCDAQNNGGAGYRITGARSVTIIGTADGNGHKTYAFGAASAVELHDAVGAQVHVGAINSPQGGVEIGDQDYGLLMEGCTDSAVFISNSAIAPATIAGDVDPASDLTGGNMVVVNGEIFEPDVELQANKGQPSGYAELDGDGLVPLAQLPGDAGAAFGNGFFGDGSDGDATLDGTNTYAAVMSKSGSTYTLIRDAYLDNLTVDSGVILRVAGFRLHVKSSLSNSGTIHGNGNNASSATGAFLVSGQTLAGSTAGGNGGTAAGSNATNVNPGHGGSGGAGGAGASGAGGTGGTVTAPGAGSAPALRALPFCAMGTYFNGTTTVRVSAGGSGGGGGGDTTNSGGGGGSAGINVIINAKVIAGTAGVISANGGNGANGVAGNSGGGGGGGGGTLIINTTSITGQTTTATGGTKGNGVGTGANGTDGSAGNVYLNVFA
jgi:hypothetical protein